VYRLEVHSENSSIDLTTKLERESMACMGDTAITL